MPITAFALKVLGGYAGSIDMLPLLQQDSDFMTSICAGIIVIVAIVWLVLNAGGKGSTQSPVTYQQGEDVRIFNEKSSRIYTITPEIEKFVSENIETKRQALEFPFDYSLESARQLEAVFKVFHEGYQKKSLPEAQMNKWIEFWSYYLGEVIRKKWGGDWEKEVEIGSQKTDIYLSSREMNIDPFSPVKAAIVEGRYLPFKKFLEETQDQLDYEYSTPDELDLEYDPETDDLPAETTDDEFRYHVYWDGMGVLTTDLSSIGESLHKVKFPFSHHAGFSIIEIQCVEPHRREREYTVRGQTTHFNLAAFVFEREFKGQGDDGSKTLILSAYSLRELMHLIYLCGFEMVAEGQSDAVVEVDRELISPPVRFAWTCPRCRSRKIEEVKGTRDSIVKCETCDSSYRCVWGAVTWANCRASRYMSTEEFFWAIRVNIGLANPFEITFKTSSADIIIREKDDILCLLMNTKGGEDRVVLIDNRTSGKAFLV